MRRDHTLRLVLVTALSIGSLLATGIDAAHADVGRSTVGTSDQPGEGVFGDPTRTDARYFPLRPGARFVYDGVVTDAEGQHPHVVIMTVTDLVKSVNGVLSRVIWDQDLDDGELAEAELAFLAQDDADNVWTMGEYPEEFEDGGFIGAPSTWLDGVAGATAGILVPGQPRLGAGPFVQGRAPAIDFYDVGEVVRTHARVCVPVGCFSDVVVIDEWSPLSPEDGHQQKYYAPGVGLVRITASSGDAQEVLDLVSLTQLGAEALAEARNQAVRLDRRAYRNAADVYGDTQFAYRPRPH